MTRLCTDDIQNIASALDDYDSQLIKKTGGTLRQIACRAVGVDEKEVYHILNACRVAIIPITSGQGVIDGFARTVQSIAVHLGFSAFVSTKTDVSGLGEAFEKDAGLIMLADDHCFIAIHPLSGRVVDNGEATGKGFATALNMMTGGLKEREVLLIGAGRVGKSAALAMLRMGAGISIYDIDPVRNGKLAGEFNDIFESKVKLETDLNEALLRHRIFFDASPSANFIRSQHITSETFVAAPGLPLGLSNRALAKASGRVLYDPLQIGVATMMFSALFDGQMRTCANRT